MRNFWKQWMMIVCILFVPTTMKATDFLLLELLITNHKNLSDRLLERVGIETAATYQTNKIQSVTDIYEAVRDTLGARYGFGLLDAVGLGTQAAELVTKTLDVVKLSGKAIDAALDASLRNPAIYDVAVQLQTQNGDKIADIYRIVAQVVSTGIKVSLATNEQRFLFLDKIRANLDFIERNMEELYAFSQSMMAVTPVQLLDMDALLEKAEEAAFEKATERIDRMIMDFGK